MSDAQYIPHVEVPADVYVEDPDYDPANSEVDPNSQGVDAHPEPPEEDQ